MFGYVIKHSDTNYDVNVNLEQLGSGYNVVPRSVDKSNKYDIEEVKAYCNANPQMVFSEHPLTYNIQLNQEKGTLLMYLAETDYMVIKCSERGLSMATEYPEDFEKRQQARDRINEIDEILMR